MEGWHQERGLDWPRLFAIGFDDWLYKTGPRGGATIPGTGVPGLETCRPREDVPIQISSFDSNMNSPYSKTVRALK